MAGIVATSGVITAVIGFSLQDTLGNVMDGMALQMEHTIKVALDTQSKCNGVPIFLPLINFVGPVGVAIRLLTRRTVQ